MNVNELNSILNDLRCYGLDCGELPSIYWQEGMPVAAHPLVKSFG